MLTTNDVKNCKVGDVVSIADIDWMVSNRTENTMSFVSDKVIGKTVWNVPYVVIKPEHGLSQIDCECPFVESVAYYSCVRLHALLCSATTFEFVKNEETQAFVHLPTKSQLEGEWDYFTDNNARKCTDIEGNPCRYWTSSTTESGRVWGVLTGGDLSNDDPSRAYGFRPAFTIKLK